LKRSFRREIGSLDDLVRFVEEFFSAEGLDPADRFAVDFALEEIFTNFVKYNPEGKGDIDVSLSLRAGELVLAVADPDSASFDPGRDAPAVDTGKPLEERVPGGLGVHLVQKVMDRVEYRHEESASTVTLYKRLGENNHA
jgi:anti-sigma regulatory factor (Ser/Thr protein kinase)